MLRSLKDIKNCSIGATDGDIGQVRDLYFDDHAWAARYLIVDPGSRLSGRKVPISPISILKPDWSAHSLPAAITRNLVKNSPDIDTDKPVSRPHEEQYLGHYGYSNDWGDTGLWGGGTVPMGMVPGYAGLPGSAAEREQAIEENAKAEHARDLDDDPHLRSCTAVIGYRIHATDDEVGDVEGFLIDDKTRATRYLVVNTSNWWLGHEVLIAPQWVGGVHWSDETVSVDLSREAVKSAPDYASSADLDRRRESGLYAHYGRPSYRKAGSTLEREI